MQFYYFAATLVYFDLDLLPFQIKCNNWVHLHLLIIITRFFIPMGQRASQPSYPILMRKRDRDGLETPKSIHPRRRKKGKKRKGRKDEEKEQIKGKKKKNKKKKGRTKKKRKERKVEEKKEKKE